MHLDHYKSVHITAYEYLTSSLEHLFNLKFAAKDLERNAKKSEKQEKVEKDKLKKVRETTYITNYCCLGRPVK